MAQVVSRPATLVLARTAIATAILLPIALLRVDLRAVLARWRWLVAFAVVEIAIPWVMLGSAEQHVSSSLAGLRFAALIAEIGPVRATVITYVNPAVAAVLAVLVLHETFSVAMGIGFGLVILGSGLAMRPARPAAARAPEPGVTARLSVDAARDEITPEP